MNIYVGNMAFYTSEEHLMTLFVEFGSVESVKIIKNQFTGNSKGFGFVEMPSNSEAEKAIAGLNRKRIDGRNITVRAADPGGKKRRKSGPVEGDFNFRQTCALPLRYGLRPNSSELRLVSNNPSCVKGYPSV